MDREEDSVQGDSGLAREDLRNVLEEGVPLFRYMMMRDNDERDLERGREIG